MRSIVVWGLPNVYEDTMVNVHKIDILTLQDLARFTDLNSIFEPQFSSCLIDLALVWTNSYCLPTEPHVHLAY